MPPSQSPAEQALAPDRANGSVYSKHIYHGAAGEAERSASV